MPVALPQCLELKPDWGKGYSRLGHAYAAQGNFAEAVKIYALGVSKEPTNTLLTEGLTSAQAKLKQQQEEATKGAQCINCCACAVTSLLTAFQCVVDRARCRH